MHPFQIVLFALVATVVIFAVGMAVSSSAGERRARRTKSMVGSLSAGTFEQHPATCDHEWRTWERGACMTGYSSYGGPNPQEEWSVEYCPLCGAKAFRCSGSCDCRSECAIAYEGDAQ